MGWREGAGERHRKKIALPGRDPVLRPLGSGFSQTYPPESPRQGKKPSGYPLMLLG
jgi:hypothetical protein